MGRSPRLLAADPGTPGHWRADPHPGALARRETRFTTSTCGCGRFAAGIFHTASAVAGSPQISTTGFALLSPGFHSQPRCRVLEFGKVPEPLGRSTGDPPGAAPPARQAIRLARSALLDADCGGLTCFTNKLPRLLQQQLISDAARLPGGRQLCRAASGNRSVCPAASRSTIASGLVTPATRIAASVFRTALRPWSAARVMRPAAAAACPTRAGVAGGRRFSWFGARLSRSCQSIDQQRSSGALRWVGAPA